MSHYPGTGSDAQTGSMPRAGARGRSAVVGVTGAQPLQVPTPDGRFAPYGTWPSTGNVYADRPPMSSPYDTGMAPVQGYPPMPDQFGSPTGRIPSRSGSAGPGYGGPAQAGPGYGPEYGGPAYGGPGNPVEGGYAGPGYGRPGYGGPAQAGPGYGRPGYGGPAQAGPGYSRPGYGGPAQAGPGYGPEQGYPVERGYAGQPGPRHQPGPRRQPVYRDQQGYPAQPVHPGQEGYPVDPGYRGEPGRPGQGTRSGHAGDRDEPELSDEAGRRGRSGPRDQQGYRDRQGDRDRQGPRTGAISRGEPGSGPQAEDDDERAPRARGRGRAAARGRHPEAGSEQGPGPDGTGALTRRSRREQPEADIEAPRSRREALEREARTGSLRLATGSLRLATGSLRLLPQARSPLPLSGGLVMPAALPGALDRLRESVGSWYRRARDRGLDDMEPEDGDYDSGYDPQYGMPEPEYTGRAGRRDGYEPEQDDEPRRGLGLSRVSFPGLRRGVPADHEIPEPEDAEYLDDVEEPEDREPSPRRRQLLTAAAALGTLGVATGLTRLLSDEGTPAQSAVGSADTPATPAAASAAQSVPPSAGQGAITGYGEIDGQHDVVLNLLQRLAETARTGSRADQAKALGELVTYVRVHFSFEESLMDGYQIASAAKHKANHKAFLTQVTGFATKFKAGTANVDDSLLVMMHTWLMDHITHDDTELAKALNEKGVQSAV
ncbi:MAG TPA: bacteriohemerythrin [Kineosporiaceae bacterium]|nr:bacteriohemerythrin [Kineosporiaceae bacterium]